MKNPKICKSFSFVVKMKSEILSTSAKSANRCWCRYDSKNAEQGVGPSSEADSVEI